MKKIIVLLLLAVSFLGCEYNKTVTSDIMSEDAVVIHKLYSPSEHSTSVSPKLMSIGGSGSPVGIGMDGPGISMGGLVISDTEVPEKWGIVFKCNHGSFTIDGSTKPYKELYDMFNENDNVTINYREVYRERYTSKDSLLSRVLVDLDFIDAVKQ